MCLGKIYMQAGVGRILLWACRLPALTPLTNCHDWQVAERGLAFVRTFSELLVARQADGHLPPLFREAWAHSACVSVAKTTCAHFAALQQKSPQLDGQQPAPADRQGRPVGCAAYCSLISWLQ